MSKPNKKEWLKESAPYWSSDSSAWWKPSTDTTSFSFKAISTGSSSASLDWSTAVTSATPLVHKGKVIGSVGGSWSSPPTWSVIYDEEGLTEEERKVVEQGICDLILTG